MAKGSPRITLRVPVALLSDLDVLIDRLNNAPRQDRHWDRTEFIVQAIVDKINHYARSRGDSTVKRQAAVDDGFPREYWGD